jgi:hypothetical protein
MDTRGFSFIGRNVSYCMNRYDISLHDVFNGTFAKFIYALVQRMYSVWHQLVSFVSMIFAVFPEINSQKCYFKLVPSNANIRQETIFWGDFSSVQGDTSI